MLHKIKKLLREALMKYNITEGYDDVSLDYIKNKIPRMSSYTQYKNKKVFNDYTLLYFDGDKSYGIYSFLGEIKGFSNLDGTEIANASFDIVNGDNLETTIDVRPDMRRKGVATEIYKFIEAMNKKKLVPAKNHSDKAELFWNQPNRDFGI